METRFDSGASTLTPRASCARRWVTFVVLLNALIGPPVFAADPAGTTEKAKEVVRDTTVTVEKAGTAAADTAKGLWQRIDEARLKNRTPDEIVAWVIMGLLVGAVAGMLSPPKRTALGRLGRLALGLAGAFLGGIVVHVGRFDFGWGPVLIRYEELFFSFLGAILIVATVRIVRSRAKKKVPSP